MKAMTSWRTSASISWMRSTSKSARSRMALRGVLGNDAGLGQSLGGGDFDVQPGAETVFVAPDAAHLGAGITWDHGAGSPVGAAKLWTKDSKWTAPNRLGREGGRLAFPGYLSLGSIAAGSAARDQRSGVRSRVSCGRTTSA